METTRPAPKPEFYAVVFHRETQALDFVGKRWPTKRRAKREAQKHLRDLPIGLWASGVITDDWGIAHGDVIPGNAFLWRSDTKH